MGLLDKIFNKKDVANKNSDIESKTTGISLTKSTNSLDKVLVDLSKTSRVDLSKHTARVALAMDYSGSMSNLFDNGSVQKTITRLLPIALKFDDDGELESWLFSNKEEKLNPITVNNYKDYVEKVMKKAKMNMGGTNYAPVLKDIAKYYKKKSDIPAFIIFITDGENSDATETNKIVRELSEYNIFIQFVGIGKERFNYLKTLDNLDGRKCDNTGFTKVSDMNCMSDEELYTELLRQYKDWLNGKQ